MFCNQCGTQNRDTAKFCNECGTKLTSSSDKLANLSTSDIYIENTAEFRCVEHIKDPYWDEVLPEIDNEIYAIPKDSLIKIATSILALFSVIALLIYML
ncbi:MAG: zinc-ribbon domain-containing protein [Lachnospiraceae bacterium]|nr:zinc-ribbon domain-containing protein [Lachnospiraceae bacterium]